MIFKPVRECQKVARNLLSFFRKRSGSETHLRSAKRVLEDMDDRLAKLLPSGDKLESEFRYHILSAMYLENRASTSSTIEFLDKVRTESQYLLQPAAAYEFSTFTFPFRSMVKAGSSARSSGGVYFWKQAENVYSLLQEIRQLGPAVDPARGIVQFLEDVLQQFRSWHEGFYDELLAVNAAFSISTNSEDDRKRIGASLCFGAATEGGEEGAAFWRGQGRPLLTGMLEKIGVDPIKAAHAVLGLRLSSAWFKAGSPSGGYRDMMKRNVPSQPFVGHLVGEIPMPAETFALFSACLDDENMRAAILAVAIRHENPDSHRLSDLVQNSFTNKNLYGGTVTPDISLEKRVILELRMKTEGIFFEFFEKLKALPVDFEYAKNRILRVGYNEEPSDSLDVFELLADATLFSYLAEAVGKYARANIDLWKSTFSRLGDAVRVISDLFKMPVNKDMSDLVGPCSVTDPETGKVRRISSMSQLELRFDYGVEDLQKLLGRLKERGEVSPKKVYDVLVNYADTCIMQAVVHGALSVETKEALNVKVRDLAFGEPQEEDDVTVVP